MSALHEQSNVTPSGTLAVAGTTTGDATSVAVNGSAAALHLDGMFAGAGFALADGVNTFTTIAQEAAGRKNTNTITVNLPGPVEFIYDLNGSLLSDGQRVFESDDENQLIEVASPKDRTEFAYDSKMRLRRIEENTWLSPYGWYPGAETRYVYDGMLVVQERNSANIPAVTYTHGLES